MRTAIFYILLSITSVSYAKPASETDFVAASGMAQDVSTWFRSLSNKPKSVGIFEVTVSAPLEVDMKEVFKNELSKSLIDVGDVIVRDCMECATPEMFVKQDRLIVEKGKASLSRLKALAQKYEVESFMILDVHKTRIAMIGHATLFSAGTGEVISSEKFRVSSLDWSEYGLLIQVSAGAHLLAGGRPDASEDGNSGALGGSLAILEEIGENVKGGLVTGGAGAAKGSVFYVTPSIAWRSQLGRLHMYSLKHLGIGYGQSDSTDSMAFRAGYDIFIGSWTNVGVSGLFLLPVDKVEDRKPITGFLGVTLGFHFGR